MKDLIEALNIFLKYQDNYAPTHCEHDVLQVVGVTKDVSEADQIRLVELGFIHRGDGWISFRFGSA